tara:strand:+ start:615 stop:902 length:288 start_codon:yes stop_codon:yes gene_type:complete
MSKEMNYQTEKKQWTLYGFMQRTWKILLITGILGLLSELIFMVLNLIINGNQEVGIYASIWVALSIGTLLLSALIALIVYGKPYFKQIRDWVYVE